MLLSVSVRFLVFARKNLCWSSMCASSLYAFGKCIRVYNIALVYLALSTRSRPRVGVELYLSRETHQKRLTIQTGRCEAVCPAVAWPTLSFQRARVGIAVWEATGTGMLDKWIHARTHTHTHTHRRMCVHMRAKVRQLTVQVSALSFCGRLRVIQKTPLSRRVVTSAPTASVTLTGAGAEPEGAAGAPRLLTKAIYCCCASAWSCKQ